MQRRAIVIDVGTTSVNGKYGDVQYEKVIEKAAL